MGANFFEASKLDTENKKTLILKKRNTPSKTCVACVKALFYYKSNKYQTQYIVFSLCCACVEKKLTRI